jgi:GGDEF domain-containing protein
MDIGAAIASGQGCAVLLLKARNLGVVQRSFGDQVTEATISAFARRLRNCLRPDDPAGRWAEDKFVALITGHTGSSRSLARRVAEHTSGAYVSMDGGKPVRPVLHIDVGVVETAGGEPVDRALHRIEEFFKV